MEAALTLIVSVLANVIAHYVCKWLDGNEKDNQPED